MYAAARPPPPPLHRDQLMNLPPPIVEAAKTVLDSRGGIGRIEALSLPRLVADHSDKYIAFSPDGEPLAIIVIAPKTHPRAVHEAAECADEALRRLGPELGKRVLSPWYVGQVDGSGFSITEFCQPFAAGRISGRWARWQIADSVFEWLRAVTSHTAQSTDELQRDELYMEPLSRMARHAAVRPADRAGALDALEALQGGRWSPKAVLCHYDFWMGNLLRERPGTQRTGGFVVIDWNGSRTLGHGFYDLVRMSISLRATPSRWRRELGAHCRILDCEAAHAKFYVLGALGHLAGALGEWPVERFAQTVAACMSYIDAADT